MLNARPRPFLQLALALALPPALLAADDEKSVSYYKQIRPIFQANCQRCHQPAKEKWGYVMTDCAKLLHGGESAEKGEVAIVAKEPDKSLLIQQITPSGDAADQRQAEMPPKKAALAGKEIGPVRRWISEGAN